MLSPELEEKVMALQPDQVTDPVKAGDAVVVIKLQTRQESRYTGYEAAKQEMAQRLQAEILEKA